MTRQGVPLRPDYSRGTTPADHLIRAAVVASRRGVKGGDQQRMLAETYGDDAPTDILLRAATAPAMIGTTNWASQLAVQSVADFVVGLAPVSAGAELIRRGLRVTLYGAGSVLIPRRLVVAADAGGFVGEGEPLQTRQFDVTSGLSLTPFKFCTIITWTRQACRGCRTGFRIHHSTDIDRGCRACPRRGVVQRDCGIVHSARWPSRRADDVKPDDRRGSQRLRRRYWGARRRAHDWRRPQYGVRGRACGCGSG